MDIEFQTLLSLNPHWSEEERARVKKAYELCKVAHEGQMRGDGTPYYTHPVAVADILSDWGADADTIIVGLLHDTVEDTNVSLEMIEKGFGPQVASLVEGVTKFTQADFVGKKETMDDEVETLRRLFEVMRKDIRVVIIKLADRLHNLRTISGLSPERSIAFARESLDVYYKIAYHLGMNELCREMTNICVPYVYPEKAKIREKHWSEQKESVAQALKEIETVLDKNDTGAVIEVRLVKSSHDLPRENKEDESAEKAYYCVMIVRDLDTCYSIFKTLHRYYRPVRRRFHDYIASPPESGYRSLHTTVIGPHKKPIQIRIRTAEMDEQVKRGVLVTAFGRKFTKDTGEEEQDFSWLKRSADLDKTTRESSEEFWEALQSDIFQKSMQVTVNGQAVSVPLASTALDAAYLELGDAAHALENLTINGQMQELSTLLHEDDVLEMTLKEKPTVSIEWLQYVTTKFARNHIVEALKEKDRGEKFALGYRLIQKEMDYFQKMLVSEITKQQQEAIAQHFKRATFEDVVVMVGEGVVPPHEVVFFLQSSKRKRFIPQSNGFRLSLVASGAKREEIVTQVSALARVHDVTFENIGIHTDEQKGMVMLNLRGHFKDRTDYADFLAALERHSWISKIRTNMSLQQKLFLVVSFFSSFLLLIGSFFLVSYWQEWLFALPLIESFLLQIIVILPLLFANYYLLALLRHYVVWLRRERWFLGLGFCLNLATCSLIVYQGIVTGALSSLLPFFAIFTFFMFYIVYRFFSAEQLFTKTKEETLRPFTAQEWKQLRRTKLTGYLMRLCAVTIWGIQPLYIKYTPASEVSPFIRVMLMGVGVLLVTAFFIAVKFILRKGKRLATQKMPKNVLLFNIIVSDIVFTYFLNASLELTTGTNFILFNNFSPVIALLIGAVLWRSSIPYLRDSQTMFWIFIVFLMGSTGSAMIIFNSLRASTQSSVSGDILGLLAMGADTLLVISQIRYMKLYSKVSSLAINMYVFSFHIVVMLPLILWYYITGDMKLTSLTVVPVLFGIASGVMAGIGKILNYETFRRIDGFIAFLMFNISILITFMTEAFFLEGFVPTWILIAGGTIIIASAVLAEVINTNAQKRGVIANA